MTDRKQQQVAASVPCRVPKQARGLQRFEDLLDAADTIISEVGVAEASVQKIAERAGASIGSLYHFFPTRDAVVEALRARYRAAIHEMKEHLREHADELAELPLAEFVDAILSPLASFLDEHRGFLAVSAVPGDRDADAPAALQLALSRRNPDLSEEEHALRASVFAAMVGSVTSLMLHVSRARRESLFRELRLVAMGYLAFGEPSPSQTELRRDATARRAAPSDVLNI